ncbi:uncharacterized protein LOC142974393 [Anticarsia gemmatalis]|uniref:uncharacterized protein LOC142974393 n=1 Tax=Anticarsia gemmatalis TaxID=129554 RepID=UPI003F766DF4
MCNVHLVCPSVTCLDKNDLAIKMLRLSLYICVWTMSVYTASGQPVSCTDEAQCSEGLYCDVGHICRECLSCSDLKRDPPLTPVTCVKSIAECGACFAGMVVDRLGDVNAACVMSGSEDSGGTPHYVWWLLIGIGALISVVLMVGIIIYVYVNPGIFEYFKIGGNCRSTVRANMRTEPSAPEAPPPYSPAPYTDVHYTAERAESPCPIRNGAGDADAHLEEKSALMYRRGGGRESAGNQAALVYNRPVYDRQDLPPSPESPIVTELDENNLAIHDDETVLSIWTPDGPSNGHVTVSAGESGPGEAGDAGGAAVANLSQMLASAREESIIEGPPAKQRCVRPTSNTGNRDSPPGESSQPNFSSGQSGTSVNIFFTQVANLVPNNRRT